MCLTAGLSPNFAALFAILSGIIRGSLASAPRQRGVDLTAFGLVHDSETQLSPVL
jgi:hypothetical protein